MIARLIEVLAFASFLSLVASIVAVGIGPFHFRQRAGR